MDNDTPVVEEQVPVEDTTNPQPENEADVQVTNEAPEASQDVKDPDMNAEDTAGEKLYAGKYKSVEDMEKAYQELNSKFTNTTQEKAELAKILNDTFTLPESDSSDEDDDSYREEVNPLAQKVQALELKSSVNDFLYTHKDVDAGAMQEVLQNDPIVSQMTTPEARMEYAYLKSKNMATSKAVVEAEKRGADQAAVKVAEKHVAQVEQAQKAEPINERADLMNRIRRGDPSARSQAIAELPAIREMKRQAGIVE